MGNKQNMINMQSICHICSIFIMGHHWFRDHLIIENVNNPMQDQVEFYIKAFNFGSMELDWLRSFPYRISNLKI